MEPGCRSTGFDTWQEEEIFLFAMLIRYGGGAGRVADLSPSSSTEVKNTWSCCYLQGAVPRRRAECDDKQSQTLCSVTQCVLCGSENKQRLFPYTALTDWFL